MSNFKKGLKLLITEKNDLFSDEKDFFENCENNDSVNDIDEKINTKKRYQKIIHRMIRMIPMILIILAIQIIQMIQIILMILIIQMIQIIQMILMMMIMMILHLFLEMSMIMINLWKKKENVT